MLHTASIVIRCCIELLASHSKLSCCCCHILTGAMWPLILHVVTVKHIVMHVYNDSQVHIYCKPCHHSYWMCNKASHNKPAPLPGSLPAHRQQNDSLCGGSFPQLNNNGSHWNKTLTTGIPLAAPAYYQVVKIVWHKPVIFIIPMV